MGRRATRDWRCLAPDADSLAASHHLNINLLTYALVVNSLALQGAVSRGAALSGLALLGCQTIAASS